MRIKIVSDGTSAGTKVVDDKTGELLEGVLMVSWSISTEEGAGVVMMELVGVPCDIVTEARNIQISQPLDVLPDMVIEEDDFIWYKKEEMT